MVLSASAGMMIITQVAMIAKEQANWNWGFVPIATLAIFNTLGPASRAECSRTGSDGRGR